MNNVFIDFKDIVDELHKRYNSNKCNKCNQEINWGEGQYKRNCPKCGSILIRSSALPKSQIKCWICMDTGIATYTAQVDENICYFGAVCVCKAGEEYRVYYKDGQKMISDYIPSVDKGLFTPPVDAIARRNRELCKEG